MVPKIKVELSENGVVQFTIPKMIMDRNIPEITYTTFQDIDTGNYIYQLSLHLEEKEDN